MGSSHPHSASSSLVGDPTASELLRRAGFRALKLDVVCSPLPGLVAGAAAGSTSIGLLSGAAWVALTFVPLTVLVRIHLVRALAGNPERFETPRWLARTGVPWAIEASHYQRRTVQVAVRGYLAIVDDELRFVPGRRQGGLRIVGAAARPWHLSAGEIRLIEAAVPPVVSALGTLPHLRIEAVDMQVEWFMTVNCTAVEAAARLNALLFAPVLPL